MFNVLWSGGGSNGGGPPSSAIKEANDHMHAMVKRIRDLEQRVYEQTELMGRRDQENKVRFQNMERQKDLEMAAMQQDMGKLKEKCRQLEGKIKEKDVQMAYLYHRCSYLDEAASYVPLLDQLSQCLKSSLAAPPPKVETVKAIRTSTGAPSGHDYTPDVPAAPGEKPLVQGYPGAASVLADHFNRPPSKQAPQQTKLPPQPYMPQYPEPNGSIFAPAPNVALNTHGGKK